MARVVGQCAVLNRGVNGGDVSGVAVIDEFTSHLDRATVRESDTIPTCLECSPVERKHDPWLT